MQMDEELWAKKLQDLMTTQPNKAWMLDDGLAEERIGLDDW
jgi:hypothetical protein